MWGIFGRIHPLRPQPCGSPWIRLINRTTIKSPGYPSNYPDNQDCTWIITAPTGSKIQMTFSDFRLETSTSCRYDYVAVYNAESQRIGTMCGSRNTTEDITTSTNKMIVKFHSDRSDNFRGFK